MLYISSAYKKVFLPYMSGPTLKKGGEPFLNEKVNNKVHVLGVFQVTSRSGCLWRLISRSTTAVAAGAPMIFHGAGGETGGWPAAGSPEVGIRLVLILWRPGSYPGFNKCLSKSATPQRGPVTL